MRASGSACGGRGLMSPCTPAMVVKPELFGKVELQLVSWCNRSCAFCPAGTFPVPKTFMTDAVAERITGELQRVGFSGALGFHLMGKPLLYKRFEQMVALFRRSLPNAYIYVHTNGDALTDFERAHQLFEAGLNQLWINCYDSREQFDHRNAQVLQLIARHRNIWYFNQWLSVPAAPQHHWRVIRLRAFDRPAEYTLRNWAGAVPTSHDEPLEFPLKLPCNRVTDIVHINYRGEIVLCNHDWKHEVIAGDLMQQDLMTLWTTSPVLQEYRAHLARGDRNLHLCRNCDNGYPYKEGAAIPGGGPVGARASSVGCHASLRVARAPEGDARVTLLVTRSAAQKPPRASTRIRRAAHRGEGIATLHSEPLLGSRRNTSPRRRCGAGRTHTRRTASKPTRPVRLPPSVRRKYVALGDYVPASQ